MLSDFIIGTTAGVVATALWTGIAILLYRKRNTRRFQHLGGIYKIQPKFPDQNDYGSVTITVKDNVLYANSTQGENPWSGEIVMNEVLPRSGAGHYQHFKDGNLLWGIHQVQVKGKGEILVHTIYAHREHRMVMKGYIWKKQ